MNTTDQTASTPTEFRINGTRFKVHEQSGSVVLVKTSWDSQWRFQGQLLGPRGPWEVNVLESTGGGALTYPLKGEQRAGFASKRDASQRFRYLVARQSGRVPGMTVRPDGIPEFEATPSGRWRYSSGTLGCHLSFTCPRCGRNNSHGGEYGNPGGGDGHRCSPCCCWPRGYFIREVRPGETNNATTEPTISHE